MSVRTKTIRQLTTPVWLLFIRFEQARGTGGVPKTWVPFFDTSSVEQLVGSAVQSMRKGSLNYHGRDLMPGTDDEYRLHNIDGGVIEKAEDIRWEDMPDGSQRAEVVLTWRIPNEEPIPGRAVLDGTQDGRKSKILGAPEAPRGTEEAT